MIRDHQRLSTMLADLSLDARVAEDGVWVGVPSQQRGSVAVKIVLTERTVTFRAFIMRAPDLAHKDVYRRLLKKNHDAGPWAFSLDALGDVFLVANRPATALDADTLDGLLGALSAHVDEVFEGIVRTGFGVNPGPTHESVVALAPGEVRREAI